MKFFQEEYIRNLPDCYNKDPTSNNYKLMQLLRYDEDNFKTILQELVDSLNLDEATGYTLNMYGDMVGQNRGLATDAQYILLIKAKIARNRCGANYQSVVDCICQVLGCERSDIYIEEIEDSCSVKLSTVPLGSILAADLTPNQFSQIVISLLPAGVTLETGLFSGTFTFASAEGEASNDEGFCQNEGDDYGGYLGVLSNDDTDAILPV